jgi:hypothetical protein
MPCGGASLKEAHLAAAPVSLPILSREQEGRGEGICTGNNSLPTPNEDDLGGKDSAGWKLPGNRVLQLILSAVQTLASDILLVPWAGILQIISRAIPVPIPNP